MKTNWSKIHTLLLTSFVLAGALLFFGGLKDKESSDVINLILTMSVAMGGFGLVAFQIAHASNELRNDFIESTILMVLSTVAGFFYVIYPEVSLLNFNFGEVSIFIFFWALILFLMILIDKRFNFLK